MLNIMAEIFAILLTHVTMPHAEDTHRERVKKISISSPRKYQVSMQLAWEV